MSSAPEEAPAARRIQVSISPDELEAYVEETPAPGAPPLTLGDILTALRNAGVIHGILDRPLREALADAHRQEIPLPRTMAAQGAAAADGLDAYVEPAVDLSQPVFPGTTIAYFRPHTEGSPGQTVRGRKLHHTRGKPRRPIAKDHVRIPAAGNTFIAEAYGYAIIEETTARIEPLLRVDPDQLVAAMDIFPRSADGKETTAERVIEILRLSRVTEGIDRRAIHDAVRKARETGEPARDITVARGPSPVPGQNAKLRFLARSGDLVLRGTHLVEKEPAVPAREGRTIYGEKLPAEPPLDVELDAGPNTLRSPDGRLLTSTLYGRFVGEKGHYRVDPLVETAADKMYATLDILPWAADGRETRTEDILGALEAAGVRKGIDLDAISGALDRARRERQPMRGVAVARGRPPVPGVDGSLELEVRPPRTRVEKDRLLAVVRPAQKGEAGFTVTGDELATEEVQSPALQAGANVKASPDGREFRSEVDGYAIVTEGRLDVEPCVTVAPDEMSARLRLYAPGPGDAPINVIEALGILSRAGATAGHDVAAVKRVVEAVWRGKSAMAEEEVARGVAPKPGEDGRFEFRIDPRPKVGTADEEGRIDYHKREAARQVHVGDLLAVLVPPVPGTAGTTVTGRALAAPKPSPPALEPGTQVELTSDGREMRAAGDGILALVGEKLHVLDAFVVQGDVDFHTGNVETERPVVVEGAVRSTFEVRSGGHVIVQGPVEDGVIVATGDVQVEGGVFMAGKGRIESGGSVFCRFAENATIRAERGIEVKTAAMSCTLQSGGWIRILEGRGAAVGGVLQAAESIEVKQAGSEAEIRTILEVSRYYRRLDQIDERLAWLQAMVAKLERRLGERIGDANWEGKEQVLDQVVAAVEAGQKEVTQLKAEREQILQRAAQEKAGTVSVWGRAHVRARVILERRVYDIEKELTRTRFQLDPAADEVVLRPI